MLLDRRGGHYALAEADSERARKPTRKELASRLGKSSQAWSALASLAREFRPRRRLALSASATLKRVKRARCNAATRPAAAGTSGEVLALVSLLCCREAALLLRAEDGRR